MRRWGFILLLGVVALAGCGGKKKGPPPGVEPLAIVITSLSDAVVGRDYSVPISVGGGTPPFTWRVSAGQLPAGLRLAATTGFLTGKPTTAGSSKFTVEAKDATNPVQTATKEFTLLVAEQLVVKTESLADATVAVNYSAQLEKGGGTGTVKWDFIGQLPAGLKLEATGVISGLPTAEGSQGFSVRVIDSASPAQAALKGLSITVLPGMPGVIARASVSSSGAEANGASTGPAVSTSGRQVAFESLASNLVDGDTNGTSDIFLFDLITSTTTRLSLTATGGEANGANRGVAISGDITAATFESDATNLISADTNGAADIYVRLIGANSTGRVSVRTDGTQASGGSLRSALSDDARFVVFASDASNLVDTDSNGLRDIFLRDRSTGATTRLSVGPASVQASGASQAPAMSSSGAAIAFESTAGNLTAPATSGAHIFVQEAGANRVVSVALQLPDTTADIFGPDTIGNSTLALTTDEHAGRRVQVVSAVVHLPDTTADIFSADTIGKSTLTMTPNEHAGRRVQIVSGTGAGQERGIVSNTATALVVAPPWSTVPDASSVFRIVSRTRQERRIVSNTATALIVAPLWDTVPDASSVFRILSEGNGASAAPAISADGRLVAFESVATNLIGAGTDTNGARDIFVHDRQTGVTTRASVVLQLANETADQFSATTIGKSTLTLAPNEHAGRLVEIVEGKGAGEVRRVVANDATTLTVDAAWNPVPDDTSVFRVVSEAAGASYAPAISADGRFVAFESDAANLVPGDTNGLRDIFVHDRKTGVTTRVSLRPDGTEANGPSRRPALGRDGRFCAFVSDATNLLALPDTNGVADIFIAFTGAPQK